MKFGKLSNVSILLSGNIPQDTELSSQEWEALVLGIFLRQLGQSNCVQSLNTINYAQNFKKIIRNKLKKAQNIIKGKYEHQNIHCKHFRASKSTKTDQVRKLDASFLFSSADLHLKAFFKQLKRKSIQRREILAMLNSLPQTVRVSPDQHLYQSILRKIQVSLLKCNIEAEKRNLPLMTLIQGKKNYDDNDNSDWTYDEDKINLLNSLECQKFTNWSIILRRDLYSKNQTWPKYFVVRLLSLLLTLHNYASNQIETGIILEVHVLLSCCTLRLVKSITRNSKTIDFQPLETSLFDSTEDRKHQKIRLNPYTSSLSLGAFHLYCQVLTNFFGQIYPKILKAGRSIMKTRDNIRVITGSCGSINQKSKYAKDSKDILVQTGYQTWPVLFANAQQFSQGQKSTSGGIHRFQNNLKIIFRIKYAPQGPLYYLKLDFDSSSSQFRVKEQNYYYKNLKPHEPSNHHQPQTFSSAIFDGSMIDPESLGSNSPDLIQLVLIPMSFDEYSDREIYRTNERELLMVLKIKINDATYKNPKRLYLLQMPLLSLLRLLTKYSGCLEITNPSSVIKYDSSCFCQEFFLLKQIDLDKIEHELFDDENFSSISFELCKTYKLSSIFIHQSLIIKQIRDLEIIFDKLEIAHTLMKRLGISGNLLTLLGNQLATPPLSNFSSKRVLMHYTQCLPTKRFSEKPKILGKITNFPERLVGEGIDRPPRSIVTNEITTLSCEKNSSFRKIRRMQIQPSQEPDLRTPPRSNILNDSLLFSKDDVNFFESELSRNYIDSDVMKRPRFSNISNRWKGLVKKSSIGEGMRGIFMNSETRKSSIYVERSKDNDTRSTQKKNQKKELKKEDWLCRRNTSPTEIEIDIQKISEKGFRGIDAKKTKPSEVDENRKMSTESYKVSGKVRLETYTGRFTNPQNSSNWKRNNSSAMENAKPLKNIISKGDKFVSEIKLNELTWDDLRKELPNEEYMAVRQKMLNFKTPALRETIPLYEIPEDERDSVLAVRREQFLQYGKIPFTVRQELEKPYNFYSLPTNFKYSEKLEVPCDIKNISFENFNDRNSSENEFQKSSPEIDCFDRKLPQKLQGLGVYTPLKRRSEKNSTNLNVNQDNTEPSSVPRMLRLLTKSACSLRNKAKNLVAISPALSDDNFGSSLESRKLVGLKSESPTTPWYKVNDNYNTKLSFSSSFGKNPSSPTNNSKLKYIDHMEKVSAPWMDNIQSFRKIDGSNNKSTRSLRSLFTSQGQKIIGQGYSEEPQNLDTKTKLFQFHHHCHNELKSHARNIEPTRSVSHETHLTSDQKKKNNSGIWPSQSDISRGPTNRIPIHQVSCSHALQGCFTKIPLPRFTSTNAENLMEQLTPIDSHNLAFRGSQKQQASKFTPQIELCK
ncbi:hypothetical protein K3495_g3272 [Podosphaera aphanis]|nr:hypothetical protein K3495_g3272 [Podosphaera aphanis]